MAFSRAQAAVCKYWSVLYRRAPWMLWREEGAPTARGIPGSSVRLLCNIPPEKESNILKKEAWKLLKIDYQVEWKTKYTRSQGRPGRKDNAWGLTTSSWGGARAGLIGFKSLVFPPLNEMKRWHPQEKLWDMNRTDIDDTASTFGSYVEFMVHHFQVIPFVWGRGGLCSLEILLKFVRWIYL